MPIRISKRKKNNRISKSEFELTSQLLDAFEAEIDDEYKIIVDYVPLCCADKELAFSEHYSNLNTEIPKDKMLFRPLRNERHSNILIEMFEQLNENIIERLEIEEYLNKNNKKRYSGYFIGKNIYGKDERIEKSYVKNIPSVPCLKAAIVAKCMLEDNEYEEFIIKMKDMIYSGD